MPQTIDLMEALKVSLAKTGAELERENAQLREEVARLRGAMEDGAYQIQCLKEQLRAADGRVVVRSAMLDGDEYLRQAVAEARAVLRSEGIL